MIEIRVGNIGTARVEWRKWTSDVPALQRLLQLLTDELEIHGGMPDPDEFIVQEVAKLLPRVQVIGTAPAVDDEATDPEPGVDRGTD